MRQELINGILVNFPFEPYDVQRNFMSAVIEALKTQRNAVLESPTGTGKTVSLLCSTLSWIEQTNNFLENDLESGGFSFNDEQWGGRAYFSDESERGDEKIKVFFASRTHSQLRNVMAELKKTVFRNLKVTILGSRDQMCIHPEVSKLETISLKNLFCQMHSKQKSCCFGSRVEKCKNNSVFNDIVDMEDLVTKSGKLGCCPYYIARSLQDTADITFLPYNYIFNHNIRKSLNINFYNSVVIVDEAHNIGKICEESCSVTLLSSDIASALSQVTIEMQDAIIDEGLINEVPGPEEFILIKTTLLNMEKVIDGIVLRDNTTSTHAGTYFFTILNQAGVNAETRDTIIVTLNKIADYLTESNDGRNSVSFKRIADSISLAFSILGTNLASVDEYYKVYIEHESANQTQISTRNRDHQSCGQGKKINFWCFNAGLGISKLLQQGMHSLILTSGTLAPLNETIKELGLVNPVFLESPHIIKNSQVLVNIIGNGPTGEILLSTYKNRENPKYFHEMGLCLQNYLRIIPDGVLVFFPSYVILKQTVDIWKSNGLWVKLLTMKKIFIEPSGKDDFNKTITEYNRAIIEGRGRGAVLLGVCRGKISEGLDFSNEFGRAVIIFGIPYPPLLDPKVSLKRQYLVERAALTKNKLKTDDWYQLEALRAINQAIGRVIRHSKDFGAILLCDVRFNRKTIWNNLSKWIHPLIVKRNFGPSIVALKSFFSSNNHLGQDLTRQNILNSPHCPGTSTEIQTNPCKSNFNEESVEDNCQYLDQSCSGGVVQRVTLNDDGMKRSCFLLLDQTHYEEPTNLKHETCTNISELNKNYVFPKAKKRKVALKPHQFDDSTDNTDETVIESVRRINEAKNFISKMRSILEENSYNSFQFICKNYQDNGDFDILVNRLTSLFPTSDPACKQMFIDCKYLLVGEDLKRFEELSLKIL